jgi:hypothetical protein
MRLQRINPPEIQSMEGYNNNPFNQLNYFMKSLNKKKVESKVVKIAQCCAKTSRTVVGCHD